MPESYQLCIQTHPVWSHVIIDGVGASNSGGQGLVCWDAVPAGTYHVAVMKTGYITVETDVVLNENATFEITIELEPPEPPPTITCYRCKPVGNGYSVPESQVFEGTGCPEDWFEIQPPCNPPPQEIPWAVIAGVGILAAAIGIYLWKRRK